MQLRLIKLAKTGSVRTPSILSIWLALGAFSTNVHQMLRYQMQSNKEDGGYKWIMVS